LSGKNKDDNAKFVNWTLRFDKIWKVGRVVDCVSLEN
jgi:hypothetical protein